MEESSVEGIGFPIDFGGRNLSAEAVARIKELLDLMANDSENLERTMAMVAEDCVWVLEPGGSEYHGYNEVRSFVETAMSGRAHDEAHKIALLNWFADEEDLCVEYTHGASLTGKSFGGLRGSVQTGTLRYCITYHFSGGKIDRVHEYINSRSSWLTLVSGFALGRLHSQSMKKVRSKRVPA